MLTTFDEPALLATLSPQRYAGVAREFLQVHQIARPQRPDLSTLGYVLAAFMHIPYENLSKIIKYSKYHADAKSLRLPDEVWQDFRRSRLGGTCFSLTFFLQSILDYCGYLCYPVMARMKAGPNHHCALVALLEGAPYLLDPGYCLDVPIALAGRGRHVFRSSHAGVELVRSRPDGAYHVYTFRESARQWRYEFQNVATPPPAFLGHWLASFHWNGMHGLCLTRAHHACLYYIHNYFMRETSLQGKINHNLKSNREQVIRELFGISPEIVEAAQSALAARFVRATGVGDAETPPRGTIDEV